MVESAAEVRVGVLIAFRFNITTWILTMFFRRLLEQNHSVGIRTRDLIGYAPAVRCLCELLTID